MLNTKYQIPNTRFKWIFLGALAVLLVVGIGLAFWYNQPPYDVNDPKVQEKLSQIEELRKNIKEGKSFVNAYIQIGHIYRELGDDRRELSTYKKLARLRPKSSPPFIAMGQFYKEHKQYELSEKNLLKAVENDPDNLQIYEDLSFLYIYCLKDREERFEPLVLDAMNKYPNIKPHLTHILAFYFKNIGNKEKARKYFEDLFELAPERKSDWEQAIKELENSE